MNKSIKLAAFILTLVVLSGVFNKVSAQVDDDEPQGMYIEKPRVFYAGLIAGTNFAQVDGDYFAGYRKIGANIGGIVYAQFAKHIAGSIEILYSQKGSSAKLGHFDKTGNYFITDYGINVDYAEIPVMINYFDKRKSHFGVGLSYSRLVNSTENLTTDPSPPPVNVNDYPFKKSDLNFLAGAELHLVKGLFLNVRFQYSVVPIRTNYPPNFGRANQYNNLWVLRLMYLFI